jgi:hypothetical protein
MEEHEAYRIIPTKIFTGRTATYHEKTARAESAEAARNDPNGFYHGMTIKHSGEVWVLCGPPMKFVAQISPQRPGSTRGEEPLQLELF